VEIAISGPVGALSALLTMLEPFGPILEQPVGGKPRIVLCSDPGLLDERLLTISRTAAKLERTLPSKERFDFRVRNLAYAEPPPFKERSAYRPVPGLTIQPYDPGLSRPEDPQTLVLDEERAFGTGRHPSTLLCLKALVRLVQERVMEDQVVLDFGCGTGLLAMAALKLGALRATGVEIDHEAAETARKNVALNIMSGRVEILEGSWERVRGTYDLIFANLVASVLLRTGMNIPGHLHEQGRAVVSGFSVHQMEAMENFFADLGLIPAERDTHTGWGCLVLKRSPFDAAR